MMPVLRQHSYRPALTYISTAALQAVWGTAMRLMAALRIQRIGSSSVYINGKAAGRIGDPVSCGGTVAEGSSNVFIGG